MLAASRYRKGELAEIVVEQLGSQEKGRVLLVESNPCDLTLARITMVKQGFAAIDSALNLRQAYEYSRCHDYQIVLIDHFLPDGDGFELLEWLDSKSVVIMLSGNSARDHSDTATAVYPMMSSSGELMVV